MQCHSLCAISETWNLADNNVWFCSLYLPLGVIPMPFLHITFDSTTGNFLSFLAQHIFNTENFDKRRFCLLLCVWRRHPDIVLSSHFIYSSVMKYCIMFNCSYQYCRDEYRIVASLTWLRIFHLCFRISRILSPNPDTKDRGLLH